MLSDAIEEFLLVLSRALRRLLASLLTELLRRCGRTVEEEAVETAEVAELEEEEF